MRVGVFCEFRDEILFGHCYVLKIKGLIHFWAELFFWFWEVGIFCWFCYVVHMKLTFSLRWCNCSQWLWNYLWKLSVYGGISCIQTKIYKGIINGHLTINCVKSGELKVIGFYCCLYECVFLHFIFSLSLSSSPCLAVKWRWRFTKFTFIVSFHRS